MSRVVLGFGLGLGLWVGLLPGPGRADDPPPVSIADLAAYRAALEPARESARAVPTTFRDLWEHPTRYQGKPVIVAGRLARVFRQPSVGQFPPLAEAWITSPRGEPTCLVFPAEAGAAVPAVGAEVRFQGTFLRQVAYKGGDAERVAPLVVGPGVPAVSTGPGLGSLLGDDRERDWLVGLAVAAGVALILLRRHLGRPGPGPDPGSRGPAPAFVDGEGPGPLHFHDEGDSHGDA